MDRGVHLHLRNTDPAEARLQRNINVQIRQYLPKGMNFRDATKNSWMFYLATDMRLGKRFDLPPEMMSVVMQKPIDLAMREHASA